MAQRSRIVAQYQIIEVKAFGIAAEPCGEDNLRPWEAAAYRCENIVCTEIGGTRHLAGNWTLQWVSDLAPDWTLHNY